MNIVVKKGQDERTPIDFLKRGDIFQHEDGYYGIVVDPNVFSPTFKGHGPHNYTPILNLDTDHLGVIKNEVLVTKVFGTLNILHEIS